MDLDTQPLQAHHDAGEGADSRDGKQLFSRQREHVAWLGKQRLQTMAQQQPPAERTTSSTAMPRFSLPSGTL